MNIFVRDPTYLEVDPQDSHGTFDSSDGDHMISIARNKRTARNQSNARRAVDVYVSLHSDL